MDRGYGVASVRRALFLATAERHVGIAINFVTIAVLSHLLSPAEIGVAAIGNSVAAMVIALRQFVTPDYLIQRGEIVRSDVHTAFTVLMICSIGIAAILLGGGIWIAEFYGDPRLVPFLVILAIAALIDPFALPITTLMRRDMAFADLAVVNIATGFFAAVTMITLAFLGYGVMSFASGTLAATLATLVITLAYRPDFWIFRFSLKNVRDILAFGGCNGITIVMDRAYEALPQLLIGRFLPIASVGIYNRANVLSGVPDRVILGGVYSIALPALSIAARTGQPLSQPYLRALSFITVFHWPSLIVLALLAHPAVNIVLGPQWGEAIPLLQVLCLASLFWFPVILTQPVLIALGHIRENLVSTLISRPIAAIILAAASPFGLIALALSQFLALPFQMVVSLFFVRRHVPFTGREFIGAIGPSAIVSLFSAAGPAGLVALNGFQFDLTIVETVLAGVLAAAGWIAGIRFAKHPVLAEVETFLNLATRSVRPGALRSRFTRPPSKESA